MGVDMLGFTIDPSHEDYVSAKSYQEMVGWISGPKRIIEITNASGINLTEVIEHYKPDMLHIPFAIIEQISKSDLPVILELSFQDWKASWSKFQSLPFTISHVMITEFSEDLITEDFPARQYPVLLSLGEAASTVEVLLERAEADGIVLRGSREQAPGLKDYDHLTRILEELDESED